jgi:hypothetical protein
MGYDYVVVGGCSFSASDVARNKGGTYGDVISEHFGAKFYNLSRAGGTVYHVNRTILEWCGKNKNKFNDTLIMLGMPQLDRLTLWSNKTKSWENINLGGPPGKLPWLEYVQPGHKLLDEFFYTFNTEDMKKYVKNCWNENNQLRSGINIIVGLQSFFKVNNIDHVFFDASAYPSCDTYWKSCDEKSFGEQYSNRLLWDSLIETKNWYKHPKYKSMMDFTLKNIEMRVSESDHHPNRKGHKYWADCLLGYINEKENNV